MNIVSKQEGNKITLALNGRFDVSAHRDFRTGSENALKTAGVNKIVLDMADVDYLDSAAMGMLLLFNERASAANAEVSIVRCYGTVKAVLEIADFSKLFKIS